MKMAKDIRIVNVPLWEVVKIHFFTFIFGVWIICKMLVKWIWDPKSFVTVQQRDSPPAFLVDSALGQHKYVKLKGVKFHYVESGSKDKPLVLLLHGFPDCWLSWRYQIPVLSEHFRVVALDLKGFGDSDKPSSRKTYKIDMILEELHQLIISLGVSSCIVVGHDIGALLGWYLAHQYPQVVDKLVAVSCPHPNVCKTTRYTSSYYRWLSFVQLPYFPELDALREDVQIVSRFHKHLQSDDRYLEGYKYAFCRKEDWTGPLNYFRNLLYVEVAGSSRTIQSPVVLITGDQDKCVKLENIVKSTDYCEKFHVKIVDGARHFPHQERHGQFNEILLKHLVKKKHVISERDLDKSAGRGIMNRMFGAVSNTVKYGNSVLDSVHKRTNGVVGSIPSMNILNYTHIYEHGEG
ncbi:epoxide hydrolase 4-like [Zophobas morio]|uniref:epoxide hydrolase 4-like n=1 Tax=Zophobas morio TaxID=2755281 RepID=UPI003082D40A